MKRDKLENFILENREDFDVYEPDDNLWDQVKKPGQQKNSLNWKTIALRVAAVVVIFIGSYFVHDYIDGKRTNSSIVIQQHDDMEEMENVTALMEAEVFYTSQIGNAKNEIIAISGNDEGLMKGINIDLTELDEVFEELKRDLNDDSDNEEVIEAMMQNYRLKLDVLEEILRQLKKSKNVENNKNQYHEI